MQLSSRTPRVPVFAYHSQNISGNDYASNDRWSLASDIEAIRASGMRVVSLADFVAWITGELPEDFARHAVVLTSDDAPIFDYEDVEYRDFGLQSSTRSILESSGAHITLFAIASEQARLEIGNDALGDGSFMTDRWWAQAEQSSWASMENHGWDHCHPAVSQPVGGAGTFMGVNDYGLCEKQICLAADRIGGVTGRRPQLFCYPYGESSDYLKQEYFPRHVNEHGMRAAVTTDPEYSTRGTNRWDIPRFVCGRDWNSPEAFQSLLLEAKQSW